MCSCECTYKIYLYKGRSCFFLFPPTLTSSYASSSFPLLLLHPQTTFSYLISSPISLLSPLSPGYFLQQCLYRVILCFNSQVPLVSSHLLPSLISHASKLLPCPVYQLAVLLQSPFSSFRIFPILPFITQVLPFFRFPISPNCLLALTSPQVFTLLCSSSFLSFFVPPDTSLIVLYLVSTSPPSSHIFPLSLFPSSLSCLPSARISLILLFLNFFYLFLYPKISPCF